MNKILLPLSLKEDHQNLINHTMHIARSADARVVLYTVYHVPLGNSDVQLADPLVAMLEGIKNQLEEIQSQFEAEGLRCTYETKLGFAADDIVSYAKNENFDLVVLARALRSSFEDFMFGSVLKKVIRNIEVPLLVVPDSDEIVDINSLVLATDFHHVQNPEEYNIISRFSKELNFDIRLLNIYSKKDNPSFEESMVNVAEMNMMEEVLGEKLISYEFIENDKVADTILNYCEKKHADWVCTISSKRDFFHRIFHHSLSWELERKSNIPVLILHDTKLEKDI